MSNMLLKLWSYLFGNHIKNGNKRAFFLLSYRIPEIFFWHIPNKAYKKVAPWLYLIPKPCVGSINKDSVSAQEAELGIMKVLEDRPSAQVISCLKNNSENSTFITREILKFARYNNISLSQCH